MYERMDGREKQSAGQKTVDLIQRKQSSGNHTGIPDGLRSGLEERYGVSFEDVRVHYNSPRPEKLGALAYTQGSEVHIGPGQEKHLNHELGHVVQQKLSHVPATTTVNGHQVNDNPQLEREADRIGSL